MESVLRQTRFSAISVRDPGSKRRSLRGVARSHRALRHGIFLRCAEAIWLCATCWHALIPAPRTYHRPRLRYARRAHTATAAISRSDRSAERRRALPRKRRPHEPRSVSSVVPALAQFCSLHRPENVFLILAARDGGSMTAAAMKKIVILGATSGIALEVQRLLAREGRELLLVARSSQRLAEIQADLSARGAQQVLTYSADLASIQRSKSRLAARLGQISRPVSRRGAGTSARRGVTRDPRELIGVGLPAQCRKWRRG